MASEVKCPFGEERRVRSLPCSLSLCWTKITDTVTDQKSRQPMRGPAAMQVMVAQHVVYWSSDWLKTARLSQLGRENRNSANWPRSTLLLSLVRRMKGVENVNVTPPIFTLFKPSHPFADLGPEIMTLI